ncbi:hypothetical protein HPB51_006024 [Rhipicephalus microplus]|uniref:Uncharacterized protein n=1 Tax=Rhipicephalus microplus TaxID=6941 RepID=A0A9J6EFB4_RHIMP|nr:hypothetical protein HPB51_006024 [Rhipicephalus microplus]
MWKERMEKKGSLGIYKASKQEIRKENFYDNNKAENLSLALARAISSRVIRERCDLLLAQFVWEDRANLRKSGTEEQYGEKEHLQDILGVARGHGYRIRPGAARRVAGCNRLRSARLRCRLRRAGIAGSVKRRFATVVRDSACASEDSADGAATTGVREPSAYLGVRARTGATGAFESVEVVTSAPEEPYEALVPLTSLHTEQRNPPQATASCTGPAVGAGAATAAARARRGDVKLLRQ